MTGSAPGDEARAEVRRVLRARLEAVAARGGTATYAEVAGALAGSGWPMSPDDHELGRLLGEVSAATDEEGRGLLSAVVVRRSGRPGPGFFRMAADRGRDTADREQAWRAELARVHAAFGGRGGPAPTA